MMHRGYYVSQDYREGPWSVYTEMWASDDEDWPIDGTQERVEGGFPTEDLADAFASTLYGYGRRAGAMCTRCRHPHPRSNDGTIEPAGMVCPVCSCTEFSNEPDEEFMLALHVNVLVPHHLVPAEWAEQGTPKRLYNWPPKLLAALHDALTQELANGTAEFDEATWVDHDDFAPSTN